MKCFSLIKGEIIHGIPSIYSNTLGTDTITDASVRFYASEQLGTILAQAAKSRYEDLFLYGYTELIPDNGPGNLFPEGSYLLDLPVNSYLSSQSTQCMKIQTVENRILLGCTKDSIVYTTDGLIKWGNDMLILDTETLIPGNVNTTDDILILEL
jgi:hypothetical protein